MALVKKASEIMGDDEAKKLKRRSTMSFIEQDKWKPPPKEDRELRSNFYGPVTDELLRKSLAETQGGAEVNTPTTTKVKETEVEKKDNKKQEYFMWWQDKASMSLSSLIAGANKVQ
jgi:hypothetical protein